MTVPTSLHVIRLHCSTKTQQNALKFSKPQNFLGNSLVTERLTVLETNWLQGN